MQETWDYLKSRLTHATHLTRRIAEGSDRAAVMAA